MWLWVGEAPAGAWKEVGPGRDVRLCAPLEVCSRVGGRESRRGSLGLLHTSPVLKLDWVRHLGQALASCQEALGEELACPGPPSPHTVSQT